MKIIADLHIHSKYSRACSKDLTPKNLAVWAYRKGINVLGTGDFTHPLWIAELETALEEAKPGLYKLKDGSSKTYFLLSAEVASIYKQGEKVRRIHNLIYAPTIQSAKKLNLALKERGANLSSDGRPIFGIPASELALICRTIDPQIVIIPAHAWTPHFGVFGSLSGFDSLKEAFGDQAGSIFAIETGLSSDPKMNWRVGALDNISLISNSDAHSLRKLGREANVLEISEAELSFNAIFDSIRTRKNFSSTIEFFPEEGKYHYDGHADCKFSCLPIETKKHQGVCPSCHKKLLLGVLHRVDDLASRASDITPSGAVPFVSTIPLEEIIADCMMVGVTSKRVLDLYNQLTNHNTEFEILLDLSESELKKFVPPIIVEAILRVRGGKVNIIPGYDGVFGKISIWNEGERISNKNSLKQKSLF